MSQVEPSDVSVCTEVSKSAVPPSDQSVVTENGEGANVAAEEVSAQVDEGRNDNPTTDVQEQADDIAITINGTTIVVIPEDQLQGMSQWVDSVNDYFDLKEAQSAAEGESAIERSNKKSAKEKLTGSLSVMGNGVRSKTVKISHDVAESIVGAWKAQANTVREIREEPDTLKQKFNDFLESLKFAIPEKTRVFNLGAFNDEDSAMMANVDIEVMLADTVETEYENSKSEC